MENYTSDGDLWVLCSCLCNALNLILISYTMNYILFHIQYLILNIPRDFARKKKVSSPSKIHHDLQSHGVQLTLIGINLITQQLLMVHDSLIFYRSLEVVEEERDCSSRQMSISSERL